MATKILLVEDDKSLREIYGVRLQAEGYEIVSANDGEQALAVAIKERPGLIITDVMMPKISGFDMLDILRSTAETKDIKVIMMTALSSDDQRMRGEKMGADKYLVKSQVGIEDVVRTVHEVLGDSSVSAAPATPPPIAATLPPAPTAPVIQATPVTALAPNPYTQSQAAAPPPTGPAPTTDQPAAADPSAAQPPAVQTPVPPQPSIVPSAPSAKQRIIQPLNDLSNKVDINDLLDKELAKEAGFGATTPPPVATTEQEKAVVEQQIQAASQAIPATPEPTPTTPTATAAPAERPTAPNVPTRDTPLQTPPRIPTI